MRDSFVLRQFCRVYLQDVPDDTTLIRWAKLIQPRTLEKFNQRLTQLAVQLKVTRGRKLRTDGTVVETNIHLPSDSSLLADSVRVLGRTLSRAKQVLGVQTELSQEVFRNRIRSARRFARQVGEAMRRRSDQAKTEGKTAYRKLIRAIEAMIEQVQQVLPILQEQAVHQAQKLAQTLETFISRAEQAVDQTIRRVLQQEKVPASKRLSAFSKTTPTSSGATRPISQLSMGTRSGWTKWMADLSPAGMCSMAIQTTTASGCPAWITTSSVLGKRPGKPVLTVGYINVQ